MSLFRPEVIEARKDRLHGDISLAVPLSWQAVGYLLFAALASALVFLAAASYSRVETVGGAIVVDKGVSSVVATRAGVISELAVVEGQSVRQGQFLARVRAEEDLTGGSTAPQRVIDAIRSQDRHLGSQAGLMLDAAAAEQSRLAAGAAGIRQEISALDQQIADQNRLVALAEEEFHRARDIATKGFLSRRDLELREATLIARRQELGRLRQSHASKQASLAETARAIAQSGAAARAQAVAIQAERSELAQHMVQFDAAKGFAIVSPVAGKVTAVTARIGQPTAAGQQLMAIVPAGGRVRVELHVPTSAAGFIMRGQQVQVAIDAFPFQQFGTVPARITEISTAAIPKPAAGGATPIYLVTAELARPSIDAFGRKHPLQPGMTLTARIVTRRHSLLEWLFEPLFAVGRR